ncbi:MAG: lipopolysaccharide biosynthesis protein [Oscillospiraceae bacterium]|nr:lipopolysaccharide biosynthesis protein [Oscillospiraceae bacterium]
MANKQNSFVKSFAIIGGSTFLNMIIGVLTTPIITRLVRPESYGQLSMFVLYTNMAVAVLCLGLDQALVRYYYESDGTGYRSALLKKCVSWPCVISLVVSVVVCVLAYYDVISFFSISVIVLLCVNIVLHLIYRFGLLVVRLEKNSKLYGLLQILYKLLYVVLAIVFLILTDIDDFVLLALATVAAVAICLVSCIWAQKTHWFKVRNFGGKIVSQTELIKYGYPYVFSMGIATLFQAADKMALNMYCSYSVVGVYASAMSLVNIFAIVQTTFNTLWGPIAMEHYAKNPKDTSLYVQANRIITVVMFVLGTSLILCKDLFAVLLGEEYREAAFVLPFLIFNPIMYTISETTCLGLVFKKKSKMQVVVVLIPCVVNIIGNTVLVPHLGGVGAAISTGISYIIFYIMRTLISTYYYPVDYNMKPFLLVTMIVSVYALYNTMHRIDMVSVIGYVFCILAIMFLYRDTVKWCFAYVLGFWEDFRKKGYAKLHKDKHD